MRRICSIHHVVRRDSMHNLGTFIAYEATLPMVQLHQAHNCGISGCISCWIWQLKRGPSPAHTLVCELGPSAFEEVSNGCDESTRGEVSHGCAKAAKVAPSGQ